jgi:hypothetical protein
MGRASRLRSPRAVEDWKNHRLKARHAAPRPTLPVVGFLNTASPDWYALMVAAFRQGLKEVGYVEGQKWRSNTVGRTGNTTGCRQWRLSWFVVRWL